MNKTLKGWSWISVFSASTISDSESQPGFVSSESEVYRQLFQAERIAQYNQSKWNTDRKSKRNQNKSTDTTNVIFQTGSKELMWTSAIKGNHLCHMFWEMISDMN